MIIGYILTVVFLVFWVAVAFSSSDQNGHCQIKFCEFWKSPTNEIGDTFAGLFGSLAFVWIIVTVLLQGRELVAQREELKLARAESKRTADALSEPVTVLKDEQKQRDELRAENEFQALIKNWNMHFSRLKSLLWTLEHPDKGVAIVGLFDTLNPDDPIQGFEASCRIICKGFFDLGLEKREGYSINEVPKRKEGLLELSRIAERIENLQTRLSEAKREELTGTQFSAARIVLQLVQDNDEYWDNSA